MAVGTVDKGRIEAAVRRLPVLPERKAEIGRAVTGLLFAIERFALKDDSGARSGRSGQGSAKETEIDVTLLAAAKELREAHWIVRDFTEAWGSLSTEARNAVDKRARATGMSHGDLDGLIDRLAHVGDSMAGAADDLETPDRPEAPPKPEDPALVIAQHLARMYTRLTGKKLPKRKGKDGIPQGPFYWLLEDVFAGAGILASPDRYARIMAET